MPHIVPVTKRIRTNICAAGIANILVALANWSAPLTVDRLQVGN
jgi:hypothetical protein